MTKSAYSRLSRAESAKLEATLWALVYGGIPGIVHIGGLKNFHLTSDLSREIYAEYILGEFNTHEIDLGIYEDNFTPSNIGNVEFSKPGGSEDDKITLLEYIQSAVSSNASKATSTTKIDFIGSSKDLFADGVLGTSSVHVTGNASIQKGEIIAELTIKHAVGQEQANDLDLQFDGIRIEPLPQREGALEAPIVSVKGSVRRRLTLPMNENAKAAEFQKFKGEIEAFKSEISQIRSTLTKIIDQGGYLNIDPSADVPVPMRRPDVLEQAVKGNVSQNLPGNLGDLSSKSGDEFNDMLHSKMPVANDEAFLTSEVLKSTEFSPDLGYKSRGGIALENKRILPGAQPILAPSFDPGDRGDRNKSGTNSVTVPKADQLSSETALPGDGAAPMSGVPTLSGAQPILPSSFEAGLEPDLEPGLDPASGPETAPAAAGQIPDRATASGLEADSDRFLRKTSYRTFRKIGRTPEEEQQGNDELWEEFEQGYLEMNGHEKAAELLAARRFSRRWALSDYAEDADGLMLKYPVERVYPNIEEIGYGYVDEDVKAALSRQGIRAKKWYLTPNDKTGGDWEQGWMDEDGYGPRMTLAYDDEVGQRHRLSDSYQVNVRGAAIKLKQQQLKAERMKAGQTGPGPASGPRVDIPKKAPVPLQAPTTAQTPVSKPKPDVRPTV